MSRKRGLPTASEVERALHAGWVRDGRASLRRADVVKAAEVAAFLAEIALHLPARAGRSPFRLVDLAAGRGLVGLLAAELLLADRPLDLRLVERSAAHLAAAKYVIADLARPALRVTCVASDVAADGALGDDGAPDLVVALHACGDASDRAIASATAAGAKRILVAPCCVAKSLPAAACGRARAESLGLPRAGELVARFVETWVMSERTLVLEAAGWHTEVVAFAPLSITPHNLVLRARRVREPRRMAAAAERLRAMRASSAQVGVDQW